VRSAISSLAWLDAARWWTDSMQIAVHSSNLIRLRAGSKWSPRRIADPGGLLPAGGFDTASIGGAPFVEAQEVGNLSERNWGVLRERQQAWMLDQAPVGLHVEVANDLALTRMDRDEILAGARLAISAACEFASRIPPVLGSLYPRRP